MEKLVEVEFLDIEENEEYCTLIENVIRQCFLVENLEKTNFYVSITLTTSENIRKYNKQIIKKEKENRQIQGFYHKIYDSYY